MNLLYPLKLEFSGFTAYKMLNLLTLGASGCPAIELGDRYQIGSRTLWGAMPVLNRMPHDLDLKASKKMARKPLSEPKRIHDFGDSGPKP